MDAYITGLNARAILDSRGFPTVEVDCFVNGSLSSSGSTSSNLVSTNTKIGYKATTMAMIECAIGGCNSKFSWPMDFVVTVAGCEPRTFRFYMGYWVHGSTTYCC